MSPIRDRYHYREVSRKEFLILAILQDIQAKEKYLPQRGTGACRAAAQHSCKQNYRIATFYRAFSLQPRDGTRSMSVLGTACHVRGAQRIVHQLSMELKIRVGETTPDRNFTL